MIPNNRNFWKPRILIYTRPWICKPWQKRNRSTRSRRLTKQSVPNAANGRSLSRNAIASAHSHNNGRDPHKESERSTCESTIESSLRRDFIRKASLLTAAAGVGATLGRNVIPESSASAYGTVTDCFLNAFKTITVNLNSCNNGSGLLPGLVFGIGGTGIASARFGCSPINTVWTSIPALQVKIIQNK